MRTTKTASKLATALPSHARQFEPEPLWDGRPTTVKLNDLVSFMATNHLRAVRSGIERDEGGAFRIVVQVVSE
jgi:hypothetical protein